MTALLAEVLRSFTPHVPRSHVTIAMCGTCHADSEPCEECDGRGVVDVPKTDRCTCPGSLRECGDHSVACPEKETR
jgi:hypothetical protein